MQSVCDCEAGNCVFVRSICVNVGEFVIVFVLISVHSFRKTCGVVFFLLYAFSVVSIFSISVFQRGVVCAR